MNEHMPITEILYGKKQRRSPKVKLPQYRPHGTPLKVLLDFETTRKLKALTTRLKKEAA